MALRIVDFIVCFICELPGSCVGFQNLQFLLCSYFLRSEPKIWTGRISFFAAVLQWYNYDTFVGKSSSQVNTPNIFYQGSSLKRSQRCEQKTQNGSLAIKNTLGVKGQAG
jgi:hypothetical protein